MKNLPAYFLIILLAVSAAGCRKEKLQWQKAERIESHTTDRLNKILFTSTNKAYIAGGDRFYSATILTTADGGMTWQATQFPQAGKGLYGIALRYDSAVVACGFEGKLLTTLPNEQNWSMNQLAHWKPYKTLDFVEPGTGIIIGGVSFNYGCIAYIHEDGKTFRFDTTAYELNDIEMVTNKTGYISAYGVVLKTTDNAVSWQMLDIENDNFTALYAASVDEVWTCGYNGGIYHTTDGGKNWERLRNGNSITKKRYHLLDIVFKDAAHGWAVGENGVVIYTNNGGDSWTEYEHFTDYALRSICLLPDGNLLVCGDNGTIYKLWQ